MDKKELSSLNSIGVIVLNMAWELNKIKDCQHIILVEQLLVEFQKNIISSILGMLLEFMVLWEKFLNFTNDFFWQFYLNLSAISQQENLP